MGYFSQSGASGNPGTQASPKRTVAQAAAVAATDSPIGTATLVGAWTNERITDIPAGTILTSVAGAYMDDQRTLTNSGAGDSSGGMITSPNDNITVQDIELRNCRSQGLNMGGANVTIQRVYVRGCWLHGIFALAKGSQIIDCEVDDPCMENLNNRNGAWAGGITIHGDWYRDTGKNRGTGTQLVQGCIVRRSWGEGIGILLCDNADIIGCRNEGSWATGIYFDGVSGTSGNRATIARNFSTMRAAGSYNNNAFGWGSENAGPTRGVSEVAVSYIDVIGNIGRANGKTAWMSSENGLPMNHVRVYGNTFYGGVETRDSGHSAHANGTNCEWRGNIYVGDGGDFRLEIPLANTGNVRDHNVFHNFSGPYAGSSFGTNVSTANPVFVTANGTTPESYQLQGSSPYLLDWPTSYGGFDYQNATRPSPDHYGAWGSGTPVGGGTGNVTGLALTDPQPQSGFPGAGFTVTWNPTSGADSYDVRINAGTPASTTDTSYTFNDSSIRTGTSYLVEVRAVDGGVAGSWASLGVDPLPYAPTNLAATGVTADTVTLGWDANVDLRPGDNYQTYQDGATIDLAHGSTSKTFTGLNEGQTYEFRVGAGQSGSYGPWTAAVSVAPSDTGGPPPTPHGQHVSRLLRRRGRIIGAAAKVRYALSFGGTDHRIVMTNGGGFVQTGALCFIALLRLTSATTDQRVGGVMQTADPFYGRQLRIGEAGQPRLTFSDAGAGQHSSFNTLPSGEWILVYVAKSAANLAKHGMYRFSGTPGWTHGTEQAAVGTSVTTTGDHVVGTGRSDAADVQDFNGQLALWATLKLYPTSLQMEALVDTAKGAVTIPRLASVMTSSDRAWRARWNGSTVLWEEVVNDTGSDEASRTGPTTYDAGSNAIPLAL
jgi:hypothetical protein